MKLILEIEFITGVCRASREPASDSPDWPPQPDRIFSALVSSWASRGESPQERQALEWLEKQPPPQIHASGHSARTAPDVYVPPDDFRQSANADTYLQILPERRPKKPRRFPVARPDDPVMAMSWDLDAEPGILEDLNAMAQDVGYIGHSASLTRCRFLCADGDDAILCRNRPRPARRRVHPGRLQELEKCHVENPVRPHIRPGAPVLSDLPTPGLPADDWLVLEMVDGQMPDIRASALVCRLLRRTLMCGYRRDGRADDIPVEVSGHEPDGRPTRDPHLSIVPMAFVGFPYADGRVFGFALVPPQGQKLDGIPGLQEAFYNVADYDCDMERRVLTLQGDHLGGPLHLVPVAADATVRQSLSPGHYTGRAHLWASATPIVLNRHLKRKDEKETRRLIADACEHVGLPRPQLERIQVGKHSAIAGAPPSRPLAGQPPWMRWRVPKAMASRPLTHAVIDFGKPVAGPVMLGAGRFTGLGLCRRLEA